MQVNCVSRQVTTQGENTLTERCDDKQGLKGEICEENVMIPHTYAVVDPRTMVVEALYAMATHGAVSTTTRADRLAIRAQLRTFVNVEHIHKANLVIADVSRLNTRSHCEEDQRQCEKAQVQPGCPF